MLAENEELVENLLIVANMMLVLKHAQCNVRSGHDAGATEEFGCSMDAECCAVNDDVM